MVPQIHENNRAAIERMLGIPIKMKSIPPEVVDRVLKAQKCMSRVSLSESLPEHTLLLLCYDFEMVPKPVPTKFGHVKEGTTMYFRVNDFEFQPCVMLGVADAQTHTYHVHLFGENRIAPENMLREQHPGDAPAIEEVTPAVVAAGDTKDEPDTESARDAELEAERVAETLERIKALWPKDKAVDCAIPGEPFFQGTVRGHGAGRWAGTIDVRPLAEKGNGYRRVPVEHVSATEPALA